MSTTAKVIKTTYLHDSNPIRRAIQLAWVDENGKRRTKRMKINVAAIDEHAAAIRAAFPDAAIVMVDSRPGGYVYEVA